MPPKRKAPAAAAAAVKTESPPAGRRVTRGSTRQLQNPVPDSVPPPTKKTSNKKPKKEVTFEETKKDGKTTEVKNETTSNGDVSAKGPTPTPTPTPTVVIEHCKQCNRFKTRALQVQKGLEKDIPGVTVMINPEKPRRGCFEIRLEGGETFISLLDMKRPFKPMTDLDMEEVIADIIGKIKA